MLMPVVIGRGQFMVDVLRDRERRQSENDTDQP
jgi:hypothetical protein